jgi:hypothetical protein
MPAATAVAPPPGDAGAASVPTCGNVDCGLNGDCSIDEETGQPTCVCDRGYVVDISSADGRCVEDRNCVEMRTLQCRSEYPRGAVGMLVSASYCSGNPFTDFDDVELLLEEEGAEGWEVRSDDLESFPTIRAEPQVVYHVYVVVDISLSIRTQGLLTDVAGALDTFFADLEGLPSDVRISIQLFDGSDTLFEFVPETADINEVRSSLDALDQEEGLDGGSTNLYGSMIRALNRIDRTKWLKELQSNRGVLSVGTVIMITDGDDEAGRATFSDASDAINASPTSVITVGLGDAANYQRLTDLGRDGSFAAPTPERLEESFAEIASRVRSFEQSLFFFGFCSPKRSGSATARVSFTNLDAACPSSECCVGGTCVGPTTGAAEDACGIEHQCAPCSIASMESARRPWASARPAVGRIAAT